MHTGPLAVNRTQHVPFIPVKDETEAGRAESLFAERARALRQAREWSQEDVAQRMTKLGFSWRQSTVAKTEAADRPIRVNEAAALATIFAVNLGELVTPEQHPLATRLSKERSMLANAHAEAERIQRQAAELERLIDFGERRVRIVEDLVAYVDAPTAEKLTTVLPTLMAFYPDGEWKGLLVDAGFPVELVEAADQFAETRSANVTAGELRATGRSLNEHIGGLVAEYLSRHGSADD